MKRTLIQLLVVCVLLVASAYITMLTSSRVTTWAPLALAVGANGIIMTLMAIGATRRDTLPPALGITFACVFLLCAGAFVAALLMTPNEGPGGPLLLGLPLRTAIVLYTVGVMPVVVLPFAYAFTFESSTLSDTDLARVRTAYATVQAEQRLREGAAPVIVAVAIVYFVVVACIATWATRRTKSASDFFVAGAGVGLWTLAIAKMAATLSGFAFIGGPGLVYTIGIGAVFIILPGAITNALGAWVLAKRMRLLGEARGLFTVPDAIGARYRSPAAQGLAAVAMLIAVVGYIATNLLALGLVIDAIFSTGLTLGIWIGTAVILAYSVAGGIMAGIYTDVFQGSVMALASAVVFVFALKSGGGMTNISHAIMAADAEYLGPWGTIGPMAAISFFFVFGVGSLGQPHVVHKFYMLRDPKQLKWYPLLMTIALAVTQLLYVGVGVAMKALVVGGDVAPLPRADQATPQFLMHYTPTLVAGLVFSGVAAAIMATVNSFMSVGAAALTHDLPAAFGTRVKNELRVGRITTVALALVAATVAQLSGTLVAFLGIFGWGLFGSTIVPALAIGLNWEGATRAGAIASIATGLAITLLGETLAFFKAYSLPAGVSVSALALVSSLLMFFAVSWLTRATAERAIDADILIVMRA